MVGGRASRGADLEAELDVSLHRVATGGEEILHLSRPTACTMCQGSGAQPGTQPERCSTCQGRGERLQQWRQGQGSLYATPCSTCRGQRIIEREEQITITIPIGIEEGMVLQVSGQGLPSRDPGGIPGDLFGLLAAFRDVVRIYQNEGPFQLVREMTLALLFSPRLSCFTILQRSSGVFCWKEERSRHSQVPGRIISLIR